MQLTSADATFALDLSGPPVDVAARPSPFVEALLAEVRLLRDRLWAGLETLSTQSGVDRAKLAIMGYCSSGLAALVLARDRAPVRAQAVHCLCLPAAPASLLRFRQHRRADPERLGCLQRGEAVGWSRVERSLPALWRPPSRPVRDPPAVPPGLPIPHSRPAGTRRMSDGRPISLFDALCMLCSFNAQAC